MSRSSAAQITTLPKRRCLRRPLEHPEEFKVKYSKGWKGNGLSKSTPSLFGKQPQDEGRTQKQGQRKDKVFHLESSGKKLESNDQMEVSKDHRRSESNLRGEADLCINCPPTMTETTTANNTPQRDHKGRREKGLETGRQRIRTSVKPEEGEESG